MQIFAHKLIVGPVKTNAYIVTNSLDNTCILIDCGGDEELIIDYVYRQGLKPLAILLTHGHFDHCGSSMEVSKYYNIDIYCNTYDVEIATLASQNTWNMKATDCYVTKPFNNISQLTIGVFTFEILYVPGHTKGSVCYIIDNFMFSGDTLFRGTVGSTKFPGADEDMLQNSLAILRNIDKDYDILSGHGNPTKLFFEKKYNREFRL